MYFVFDVYFLKQKRKEFETIGFSKINDQSREIANDCY